MHCLIVFPFFSSIWRIQIIWSVVDLLRRNPHWWSPIISSAYGINLESRMLDKNFVRSWQKWYAPVVITVCFIPLLVDRYYDRLFPLSRQFLLIPNSNGKFMNRTANQPNIFRAVILPIYRSTRLCVTVCGIIHPRCLPAGGRQHRGCIIPQTVTHSLVLLKMGKIIARNMLGWLELLISRYCCI